MLDPLFIENARNTRTPSAEDRLYFIYSSPVERLFCYSGYLHNSNNRYTISTADMIPYPMVARESYHYAPTYSS